MSLLYIVCPKRGFTSHLTTGQSLCRQHVSNHWLFVECCLYIAIEDVIPIPTTEPPSTVDAPTTTQLSTTAEISITTQPLTTTKSPIAVGQGEFA